MEALNKSNQKKVIKTWSRVVDHHAGFRRPHVRRAQREQVHPGLHPRGNGRAQARRVRARRGSSAATPASGKRRARLPLRHRSKRGHDDMEARAINRYIGSSPRKMRLVIDLIRGKSVERGAAHPALLAEARVEGGGEGAPLGGREPAEQGRAERGSSRTDMVVKEAFVDGGMTMKRILPGPDGARLPDPQAVEPRHDRRGGARRRHPRAARRRRSPRPRRRPPPAKAKRAPRKEAPTAHESK